MSLIEKIKGLFGRGKKDDASAAAAAPAKEKAPKAAKKADAPAAAAGGVPAELAALLPGPPPGGKIKFAHYWGASCGGCDVSILDIDEKILTVGDMADIVFWPIAVDSKVSDVEAMEDGEITVCLFNGAVRNSENEHMAKLLRQKSQIMIAYGTCAVLGGMPGLANTSNAAEIMNHVHNVLPTSAAFQATQKAPVLPQVSYQAPEGELTLPVLYDTVKALDQVLDVDYYVPGCPPTQKTIGAMLEALINHVYNGADLPPKGAYIGAEDKTLCDECPREKENRRITKVVEPHEIEVDPELCLMDQGIICLGPATRAGCGAPCTQAGQPCRGCYGPTSVVDEQGASMLTALASLFPVLEDDPNMDEDDIIDIMSQVKDPLGYFYQFSMAKSLINRSVRERGGN